jgi:hypothetical protein
VRRSIRRFFEKSEKRKKIRKRGEKMDKRSAGEKEKESSTRLPGGRPLLMNVNDTVL